MELSLDSVQPGVWVTVAKVETSRALKNRLEDFGLVPGTGVCCRYRSPDGTVTALELRGTVIALRTRDVHSIRVRC